MTSDARCFGTSGATTLSGGGVSETCAAISCCAVVRPVNGCRPASSS